MNIRDHISKSLKQYFGLKNLYSFMRIRIRDPESFLPWIGDTGWKEFGSGWTLRLTGRKRKSALLQIAFCFEWLTY
jgi:hypothetical protein